MRVLALAIVVVIAASTLAMFLWGDDTPTLEPLSAADRAHGHLFTADGKTYFAGVVNGFKLYGPEYFSPERTSDARQCPRRKATLEQIAASPWDFRADYVPDGFDLALNEGSICDEVVTVVSKVWRSQGGSHVAASHGWAPSELPSIWGPDDIKKATIRGGPAIVLEYIDAQQEHSAIVVMLEDGKAVWSVSGSVSVQEALKVAAGLH